MDGILSEMERRAVDEGIRGKYRHVATSPRGLFRFPTGRTGLECLGYDPALITALPRQVAECYCGVGNPLSLGEPRPGQAVLDIGCGAGVDTLLAARLVGPGGRAVGLEPVPEMLARARANLALTGLGNLEFLQAWAEDLPLPAQSFDLVISNGALNLVPGKARALAEVWRVLRPGGRLQVADQVLSGPDFPDRAAMIACWFT
ncbi:MAG: methyltransferase domain-containing protein [Pseudomonadota bacterium]